MGAQVASTRDMLPDIECRDNAKFIVRACNSHYELVEACQAVQDGYASGLPVCLAHAIKKLNKALAKAKGEA
jgi:hypothetical protein